MLGFVTKFMDNQKTWLDYMLEKDQNILTLQKEKHILKRENLRIHRQSKYALKQADLFRKSHLSVVAEVKELKRLSEVNLQIIKDTRRVLKRNQETINFLNDWLVDDRFHLKAAPGIVLELVKNEMAIV